MTLRSGLGRPPGRGLAMTTVPGTSLTTSVLGFGCAELYSEPSATQRRRLLDAAHDAGIRHFDVAPMYGLGLAERDLGRFARGRRNDVVIATKFGTTLGPAARSLAQIQGPVRRLLRAFPALRQQARSSAAGPASGRAGALLYRATGFDAAAARASLEHSLRELHTDYVDLLLLHDPQPGDVRSDDVCGYLEDARRAGRILAWGIAGEPEPTFAVARSLPVEAQVLQVRETLLCRPTTGLRAAASRGRITFGILGRSIGAVVSHVTADPQRRRRWQEAVGADCSEPTVTAGLLLRLAARNNADGVVLFSTVRVDHVRSAAAAMSLPARDGADDLDAFARLLEAELRDAPRRSPGAER